MKKSLLVALGAILLTCAAWPPAARAATEAEKLAAIQAGLAHLYATQVKPDGYWSYGSYPQAATGAAAFALLSQQDKWPTALVGDYQTAVDNAMAYLLSTATAVSVSTRNDGVLICPGGAISCTAVYWYGAGETTYTTGLVAPAVALYGVSKGAGAVPTPVGPLAGMTWGQIAQGITNTFAAGQSTALNGNKRGGWRYFPGDGDSDSSTTQWAVISLLYDQTLGASTPAVTKIDLPFWLAAAQVSGQGGAVCYQPGYLICDHSDTGGWLVAKQFVGAGLDSSVVAALGWLNTKWTADASGTWYGNFGHPYAMWAVYKGLETTIGLTDTTYISPPLKTDCGASRAGGKLPGIPPGSVACNWWEDYNEWLVINQNSGGSWGGYESWVDPLSTAFYVNILGATVVPANQPPVAKCKNVTVAAGPTCTASASIDDGSFDPDSGDTITLSQTPPGPYTLGPNTVTLTVTDSHGASSSCSATVTVVDQTAPTVTSSVGMASLWPPQHDMVNVGLSVSWGDNCTAAPAIGVAVFGNEDDETPTGDGNFSPDANNLAPGTLRLRSERKGDGTGRVYLIVSKATDASGNVGASCSTVVVPQSQNKADQAAVAGAANAAKAYCAAHNATPPPGYFVIGDGPVIGPKQ